MREAPRDYGLAAQIGLLPDDMLIGSAEIAALFGYSKLSIQTGSVTIPGRVTGLGRKMQWRLGDVRAFIRNASNTGELSTRPRGRPSKAQTVAARLAKKE